MKSDIMFKFAVAWVVDLQAVGISLKHTIKYADVLKLLKLWR